MSLFHIALGTGMAARRLARLREEAAQQKKGRRLKREAPTIGDRNRARSRSRAATR
jgi:hypothetical protein